MALNYQQLKTEIQTDPLALGYAPLLAAGNQAAIADLLNEVRAGIGIDRLTVPAWEVFDAIVPAEWAALLAQEKQRIQIILSLGTVPVKGTNTRNAFLAAFAAGTATRSALAALQTRPGSRAEQLFSQSVSPADIAQAMVS